jgi:hypothetical protein
VNEAPIKYTNLFQNGNIIYMNCINKGRHGSEKFTNTYIVHGIGIMIYFIG